MHGVLTLKTKGTHPQISPHSAPHSTHGQGKAGSPDFRVWGGQAVWWPERWSSRPASAPAGCVTWRTLRNRSQLSRL